MEKLNIDDAFVMEIVVDKINEMIDKLMEMDERLSKRISNHWKYHRYLSKRIELVEDKLGIKQDDTGQDK